MTSGYLVKQNKFILHIDMNSFFASVEQQANPFIRGKPVGVAHSGYEGAAILAASYEAKACGVGTGTRVFEARKICPGLIIVPLDTTKYYAVNRQFVKILKDYTPQVEIYSIDEAFLDVTKTEDLFGGAYNIAQRIKERIKGEIGEYLTCSIGIAPNKLLAKVGSNFKKPDGLTIIKWEERFKFLDQMGLERVWGIGRRVGRKMGKIGIKSLREIRKMEDCELRSLVGGYYTRLRLIANGEHFEEVKTDVSKKIPKSMQHAHTLSDASSNSAELLSIMRKQAERLARRLRRRGMKAKRVYLAMIPSGLRHYGWNTEVHNFGFLKMDHYTDDGYEVYKAGEIIFNRIVFCDNVGNKIALNGDGKIRQLIIGVSDFLNADNLELPMSLFGEGVVAGFKLKSELKERINRAFDKINDKYGEFTLRTGDILYQFVKEKELDVEREQMMFHPGI
ncbi:DNA polymerase IV [Candidatus Dojkabacteria bacterium]|nr:DNA polymerase IV [Candidatus Dojkabacteria bacterium]